MCVSQTKLLIIMNWTIKLKRVYEPAEADDGLRILVDRIWPRGIKKSDLKYDIWAKDVTPSSEARQFFHADPSGNWDRFSEMYREELRVSDALRKLADQIRGSGFSTVTLLYGFRNPVRNHAVILKEEYPGVNAISNSRAGKMKKGLCARQSFAEDSEFFTPDFPREFFVG